MEAVNNSPKKELSVAQGSAIITGSGVGAGVLAMPILADKVGYVWTILILLISLVAVHLLNLMIADICVKTGGNKQIVDVLTCFIRKDKVRKTFTIIFFILMCILLFSNLTAYITGAADILSSALKIPKAYCKIIFFIVAAVVALFGLKILGVVEKYAVIGMVAVILALGIGSFFFPNNYFNVWPKQVKYVFNFIGMSMFAFNAFFNVPQVVDGLNHDTKKIHKSLAIGLVLNCFVCLLVITGSLLSSKTITDPCITGWAEGLGTWATVCGSIFTILALLTSYWSLSFALRDIIQEHSHLNVKLCWAIATIPTIGVSFIPFTNFQFFLNIAATAVALLLAVFAVPCFHTMRKRNNGQSILKWGGTLPFQIFTLLCYIAMAIGNIWAFF